MIFKAFYLEISNISFFCRANSVLIPTEYADLFILCVCLHRNVAGLFKEACFSSKLPRSVMPFLLISYQLFLLRIFSQLHYNME